MNLVHTTSTMINILLLTVGVALLIGPQPVSSTVQSLRPQEQQQVMVSFAPTTSHRQKVHGESPAYYCSDPTDDIFQFMRLDFIPTNPRM